MPKVVWNRKQADALIKLLSPPLLDAGYYLGLTGSVLFKGTSSGDLDLIVYPENSKDQNVVRVAHVLKACGLKLVADQKAVHRKWDRDFTANRDFKHVEIWSFAGKKVDVFYLS